MKITQARPNEKTSNDREWEMVVWRTRHLPVVSKTIGNGERLKHDLTDNHGNDYSLG